MEIVQLHSMGGCGTHLVLEMFERVGVTKLVRPVLLLQAIHRAREAPKAPCPLIGYAHLTAAAAVDALCREIGIAPVGDLASDDTVFAAFAKALAAESFGQGARRVIGHHYYLSHEFSVVAPGGQSLLWTAADRDAAQGLLERAAARCGIALRQTAVVRHPVDIFLSQSERYAEPGQRIEIDPVRIEQFFALVARLREEKGMPVVRYEDLCTAGETRVREFLRKLCFSDADIARLDLSVIHRARTEKWVLYPPGTVDPLAARFAPIMSPYGYACPKVGGFARRFNALRRRAALYRSEFTSVNRIAAGDFSADAAFSRHRRSLWARAWFRLLLCVPEKRRNVERFYRERKNSPLPARPLRVVMGEAARGLWRRGG